MVWEQHAYINKNTPSYDSWKIFVNWGVTNITENFGKPIFMGEYEFDPPNITTLPTYATWKAQLKNQVDYMDLKGYAGRNFHAYDYLYGEHDAEEVYADSGTAFSSLDSEYILDTCLGVEQRHLKT